MESSQWVENCCCYCCAVITIYTKVHRIYCVGRSYHEDTPKNEDNLKSEDNLKNEDDDKNEHDLKNGDDLKKKTILQHFKSAK